MRQFTSRTFLIIMFFAVATALALSLKVFSPHGLQDQEAALIRELRELEEQVKQMSSTLESAQEKDREMKQWLEQVAREHHDSTIGKEANRLLKRIWGSED